MKENNGTNPNDKVIDNSSWGEAEAAEHYTGPEPKEEEFNWSKYQQQVLNKWVNKCGTMEQAIVDMDAIIASLEVAADSLREMIEWDDEEVGPCIICKPDEEEV